MKHNFYVYAYYRLDTNEIFYIEKGHGGRCYNINNRGKYFKNICNKVDVAVVILIDNLTEDEAFMYECEAINTLVFEYGYSIEIEGNRSKEKGCHLVNQTWGGEGVSTIWSEERKQRKHEQMTGKTHSTKAIEKMSIKAKERKAKGGYDYLINNNKDRESRPVAMINIETGEVEEIFMSMGDAVEHFGLPRTHTGHLSNYLRYTGEYTSINNLSYHGYEWVYLDEYCDLANAFDL